MVLDETGRVLYIDLIIIEYLMEQSPQKPVFDSINKANRILIAIPSNAGGDAIGAGLALYSFAKKLDKEAEIATSSRTLEQFSFLPHVSEIKHELEASQSFVISVNTSQAALDELSYEAKPDRVDIFLKPKTGKFSQTDVSFKSARFPYDLIITLHTPSLDNLGEIYEKNTDLFFETPIINIDHHPNNEYYGQINHVDLTATSTAEIVANLIEEFESGLMDESIATSLLTGIIVETNSFQHVKTTPKAFLKASQLIAQGGRHQDIIRELYKTKSISLLKLWGRALARLREIKELSMAYSIVNFQDIEKTAAKPEDISGVMKELVVSLTGSKIILFLAETAPQQVAGFFHLHPSVKAQVFASALSAQMLNGSSGKFALKDVNLLDAEKDILEKLTKIKDQITV